MTAVEEQLPQTNYLGLKAFCSQRKKKFKNIKT